MDQWEPSVTGNQMWTAERFVMGRDRFGKERYRARGFKGMVVRGRERRTCSHVHRVRAQAVACGKQWARYLNSELSG